MTPSTRASILIAAGLLAFPVYGQEIGGHGVRIIDGDTLALGSARVRLWGIDSPELPTRAGRRAKAALERIVGDKPLRCVQRDTDRYRRIVAMCFLPDGRDIARVMVDGGWARDWERYSKGYYR